jgi:hypothetical protein
MIFEDYFLRMINQLANVLASVLGLMKVRRYDEAVEGVEASSKQLLGMDLRFLTSLTDSEFVRLLSLGDRFDVEKCVVVAELLRIVGDIRQQQGRERDGSRCHATALSLFLELLRHEAGILPQEYCEKIEKLAESLPSAELSADVRKKLFLYYESVGRFEKAENLLFGIVEQDVSFMDDGLRFYGRLRMRSDEELERGNLPRNEIESSVMTLTKLAKKE